MRAILLMTMAGAAMAQTRPLESVVPALDYGPECSSSVELVNASDREVAVEIQGHKSGGALVLLAGQTETMVRIAARGRAAFRLQVEDEAGSGWVLVRESGGAAVAVSASVECIDGDRLVTAAREVVYPMLRPWFAGEVRDLAGGVVTAINVSDRPAMLFACYSSGTLFSNGGPELMPLCSATVDLQIPPFGTRRVAVEHGGNSWFSVTTTGETMVLEMLRPLAPRVKLYKVDSTIQFGQEVGPGK